MECKFIKHGIATGYNGVMKPCCVWRPPSDQWKQDQTIDRVTLEDWHSTKIIKEQFDILNNDQWPDSCQHCKTSESQGRTDSIRLNGNRSYANYQNDDITLEIRPGNTCNFACQTCWPEASSRVAQYYHQLGIIDIKNLQSQKFENFDLLVPIAHRIRDVVLLGGEPFYDKSCRKFLIWAEKNLNANLMMFTNGSIIDWHLLNNYNGKITLIFSLDAIGTPAEYIRLGTDWNVVRDNFLKAQTISNLDVRVNITTSFYNYIYLEELIEMLCQHWPKVVSFGCPTQKYFNESSVPEKYRPIIIQSLQRAVDCVSEADIESGQKSNAVNALTTHIKNLQNIPWSPENYAEIQRLVKNLDSVKGVNIVDYCEFTALMLSH